MSMLFAATYPERTRALVLYATYAHYLTWVLSGERLQAFIDTAHARSATARQHHARDVVFRDKPARRVGHVSRHVAVLVEQIHPWDQNVVENDAAVVDARQAAFVLAVRRGHTL